jgi:hypothetical protein
MNLYVMWVTTFLVHTLNLAQCGEDTDRESTTTMDESRLSSSEDATDEASSRGHFFCILKYPYNVAPPQL